MPVMPCGPRQQWKPQRALAAFAAVAVPVVALAASAAPPERNGFTLEPRSIELDEIRRGGPPRDGIPALDHPLAMSAAKSPWRDHEMVIGVTLDGESRAYPLAILVWHELANDTLAGRPILVSYCPLCGTGIVFDRRIDGRPHRFGVSGLLYQSDLLMYDRESESLWSQIGAEAVTGPSLGSRLTLVRSRMLTWGEWKQRHPATTVLSKNTGHARRYGTSPYGDYERSREIYFPTPRDRRYHPKMRTLGLRLADGTARAYPAKEIEAAGGSVREQFAGRDVVIHYEARTKVFDAKVPADIEVIEGFWFAWATFHPETTVFGRD